MSTCFVMMPFGGYFDDYYASVFKPAIESAGVSPIRADEIYGAGAVIDEIHKAIVAVDVCVADVTGRNPNVSYELGMSHATQRPVILVTQDIKDVPFDYKHLRLIKYDPKQFGWQTRFKESIAHTINEVRKKPSAHLALKVEPTTLSLMQDHLKRIFYYTGYDVDRANKFVSDELGNTLITTLWKVTARTPVFHLCHNIVTDKPGRIEVRRVFDKLNARELEHIAFDKSSNHLSYFLLFRQFKEVGEHFEVETEVFAENYFDLCRFAEARETLMSTQAVENGIRYVRKSDWIYLPKVGQFAGVHAEYLSHPRPGLVGSKVLATETPEHFVLRMHYDADEPYQQATAALLRLPGA